MALATNITRRIGSKNYYVRIFVPKSLQAKLGKADIWQSLKTTDAAEAKRRARPIIDQYDREFARLKAKRALTDHELQIAVWERYTALVRGDQQRRAQLPTEDDLDDVWELLVQEFDDPEDVRAWRILEDLAATHDNDKKERSQRLALLKAELAKGETKSVKTVLAGVVETRDLNLPPRSAEERNLAQLLQRAEVQALARATERDAGDFGGSVTDPAIKPPSAAAPLVAAPGESIMELFEAFARDNPNGSRPETMKQSRTVVELFSQFAGKHLPAAAINKKEVRDWKEALRHYPVKATETAEFKGQDFRQTVDTNRKLKKRAISDKTLNRYLAALGSYCKWLVAHGYLNDVPTSGMFIKVDKSRQKVFPYKVDELKTIFSSPLYVGCLSDRKPHTAGNHHVRDHRFWVPLISLFSGARMGEICQLMTSDIVEKGGSWVLRITNDDSEEKHLKTKGSQRIVPIHPMLIELGLLSLHKQMVARGEEWLFPEIILDSRGSRSGKLSDSYRKYVRRIGVKIDNSVNFHSFRHSFTDALRGAGHLDHQFAFLLGHTQNNVTGRYGALQEGDLARRRALIDSVSYEDLDLSHLVSREV
jgi:integrase